jgi:hypothetical protein
LLTPGSEGVPNDFTILISIDRSRWENAGSFQLENNRQAQSFNLTSKLACKFVRVNLTSTHADGSYYTLSRILFTGYDLK